MDEWILFYALWVFVISLWVRRNYKEYKKKEAGKLPDKGEEDV